jgi:hypothetical protein
MEDNGSRGMLEIKQAGAKTIAQDEPTFYPPSLHHRRDNDLLEKASSNR